MKPSLPKRKIQQRLLRWFEGNARDLPWRRTRDPYAIWVSEIMLQQTQVPTVIPYYQKFLKTFPTVRRLAKADLSEVLSIWEGLGYYSRARNLHRAAQEILDRFEWKVPDTLDDLLSLPGIGRLYGRGNPLHCLQQRRADSRWKREESPVATLRRFRQSGRQQDGKIALANLRIPCSPRPCQFLQSGSHGPRSHHLHSRRPPMSRMSPLPSVQGKSPGPSGKIPGPASQKENPPHRCRGSHPPEGRKGPPRPKTAEGPSWGVYGNSQTGKSMTRKIRGNNWRSGLTDEMGLRVKTKRPAGLSLRLFRTSSSPFSLSLQGSKVAMPGEDGSP